MCAQNRLLPLLFPRIVQGVNFARGLGPHFQNLQQNSGSDAFLCSTIVWVRHVLEKLLLELELELCGELTLWYCEWCHLAT